jgi:phosphoribosylaminoimidazolecarboxamide formyltransferase/IMP cyclohydrolase
MKREDSMITIRRALVSVSDKTGIVEFCRQLSLFKVEILSTGGTARTLRENNIPVIDVSDYTGFPEMLDGRVKTLHPKIHGGLLALRANAEHRGVLRKHGIGLIDMVVVNLYPFQKTVAQPHVTSEEAIENIDIGGPSMLRSAAKNHQSVVVVSSPAQYPRVYQEMSMNKGGVSEETAAQLGAEVFRLTSAYDGAIHAYLGGQGKKTQPVTEAFPESLRLEFVKVQDLRYGENPHQGAAFYKDASASRGLINMNQLQGKELSYNNILDLNSVWELLKEFSGPAVVIVKHNNPCGVAEAADLSRAFKDAHACDPLSAFGGIVGLNRPVDAKIAKSIAAGGFLECIIAPAFSPEAREIFAPKKNLRLLELNDGEQVKEYDYKKVSGGLLLQDKDIPTLENDNLKVVTRKKPTKAQLASLLFAWKVAKHVKSNAIVLSQGSKTVGIGAGQMSRVDSMIIAKRKAGKEAQKSCMASDAFFPKADAIVEAARGGVVAIIHPGGSIADAEIIKACDKYKIAMVTTGMRHFKH